MGTGEVKRTEAKRKQLGEGAAQLGGFPHATQQGHVHLQCGCRLHTHTHAHSKDMRREKGTQLRCTIN